MATRVTNGMMNGMLFNNMQANLNEMLKLQEQMTTQRKFSKPSDDPIAVARSLGISTSIFENEQYIKNQQDAVSWLRATDNTFNQLLSDAQRIRELTIYAGDGALSSEELKAISTEIQQIKESMRNTANTSIAGKYLLSGLDTGTKPFTFDAFGRIVYNGSDKKINYEIEKGVVSEVSFAGSEVFASNEKTYNVKSHYVPIDWTWTGRAEKIQIRLGDNTIVKVQIPEIWIDEIATGNTEFSDFNKFRDTDELRGITMDQLAELFSRSIQEGGADKLIGVKVEKDLTNGVQRLVFTSNTGEPLQITGWPDTDMAPLEQSIAGLSVDISDIDWNSNTLMGDKQVTFPLDAVSFDISVGGTVSSITLPNVPYNDMATLLNDLNIALPATVRCSEVNGHLVLQAPGGETINVSGVGASKLFGNINASVLPDAKGLMGSVNAAGWIPDKLGKAITVTANGTGYDFELDDYSNIYDLVRDINLRIVPMSGEPDVASIVNGRISLRISGDISVADKAGSIGPTAGGTMQLFGVDSEKGTASSLSISVGGSNPVQIFIGENDTLKDIALKIESVTGMAARVSSDGTQLVVVAKRDRPYPEDFLSSNVAADTLAYPKFSMTATGGAVQLFNFQLTSDVNTGNLKGSTVSQEARRATDHSHIDLLSYLGMETALKSVEFPEGQTLEVGAEGLHWRITSGNNVVDLKLSQGSYTMEQIAERLRNAGLGWLEVTVDVFLSPQQLNQDVTEAGLNTSNNYEGATSRLVIKAVQNMPVIFLDINDSGYADMMGLSTAIRTDNNSQDVVFSCAACLDPNTPACLKVVVGDEKEYTVKLNRKDVVDPITNLVDRNKVMAQIAKQVNEKSGMELLRVIKSNENAGGVTQSSLYSTTGEPLSIIDMPVPDSSWSTYSMGIATQMGIHAGITATPAMLDNETVADIGAVSGTIRIRSMGLMVDIDVEVTDTVKTILDKIRDQAGDWLEVNYFDPDMSVDGSNVMFAICAKDGSAVSIYDLSGTVAKTGLQCDNAVNGTVDLNSVWPTFVNGDILTISAAGYSHTIDLYTAQESLGNFTPEALAELINTRFQSDDIRAEINKDGQMILYSPRGYKIQVDGSPAAPLTNKAADIFGASLTNQARGGAPNSINCQQNITKRSGANTQQASFFDVLDNLSATMEAENRKALSESLLPQIDKFIDNLLKCMATEGALEIRYTNNIMRFQSNNINLVDLYDEIAGIDLSKAATDMAMLTAMYQASLSVVSRIIQPTLVDFLR
ncbi:MAG: flagellar hook-associated protein FlgL [Synergistaceae bacterium]|nr:flagellar hook-associated protein FlgL [Synergistaceae bacterium]